MSDHSPRPTIRQSLIARGMSTDDIAAMAQAYDDMGDTIDRPDVPTKPLSPSEWAELEARAASTLAALNARKGITYY